MKPIAGAWPFPFKARADSLRGTLPQVANNYLLVDAGKHRFFVCYINVICKMPFTVYLKFLLICIYIMGWRDTDRRRISRISNSCVSNASHRAYTQTHSLTHSHLWSPKRQWFSMFVFVCSSQRTRRKTHANWRNQEPSSSEAAAHDQDLLLNF